MNMVREHILDLNEDQLSLHVRGQMERMLERESQMTDWQVWCWFDQMGVWYHYGQVSGFVKAALWPWPFYDAPPRDDDAEIQTSQWVWTAPSRPVSSYIPGVPPRGTREQALAALQAELGTLPPHVQVWPVDGEMGLVIP